MCRLFCYFLVGSISFHSVIAQEMCFVKTTSIVRRDSIRVVAATSQKGCNIRCVDTPGCEACMYYEDKGNCVLLGPAQSPPPGSCPVAYTCYEKRFSGCQVCGPPPIDRGYTPGPCSTLSDVIGTPALTDKPCGIPPMGDEKVVIDMILHDGTRLVMENTSTIQWDSYLCSWFHLIRGIRYYFKSAACVRPPATPLAAECACAPLFIPMPPPVNAYLPTIDTYPCCPGNMVYQTKRITTPQDQWYVGPSTTRQIFCAMGEWMYMTAPPGYGESSLVGAACY